MQKKRLIINADEFGAARCVTDAVTDCLSRGVLTSTSIVAAGRDFDRAARLVKGRQFCGLHLSLSDFEPVAEKDAIPSLLSENGRQLCTPQLFVKRYFAGRVDMAEVKTELESQITKCLDSRIPLTHIDGHCNLHVLPKIFGVVTALMRRYGIKKFRLPRESALNIDWSQPGQYVVKSFIALFSELARKHAPGGFITTDHFIGIAQSTRIGEDVMLGLLRRLKFGTTEIPIHPRNYVEEEISEAFGNAAYARTYFIHGEKEKEALLSEKVKDFIGKNAIELINYGDL